MVPFAGWLMPLSYTSQIEEHHAVRRSVGVFDVSHMGEILVEGAQADAFCDWLLPNKVRSLTPGSQSSYHPLCRENGSLVDDLYLYYVSSDRIFICVNASNTDKDFAFMTSQAQQWGFKGTIRNVSQNYAQIAVQGPKALTLVQHAFPEWKVEAIKRFRFTLPTQDVSGLISRTGYTGEQGVEIYMPPTHAVATVDRIFASAKSLNVICLPAGLGCRDTLRLEAGYPLYGHELDDEHTAIESGLGRFCDFTKGDFCGRAKLLEQSQDPRKCREWLIGFKSAGRRAPRAGHPLHDLSGQCVGRVVSGAFSPTLGVGIGTGFVNGGGGEIPKTLIAKSEQSDLEVAQTAIPFYSSSAKEKS